MRKAYVNTDGLAAHCRPQGHQYKESIPRGPGGAFHPAGSRRGYVFPRGPGGGGGQPEELTVRHDVYASVLPSDVL